MGSNQVNITIDGAAARRDVQRIQGAMQALNEALNTVNTLTRQAQQMRGQTGTAIVEKSTEMATLIRAMSARMVETSGFINDTVAKYQAKDEHLGNVIAHSGFGGLF